MNTTVATTPKARGIAFSTPMVRAIMDGRKSQTRRIVKPQPKYVRSKSWSGGAYLEFENGNKLAVSPVSAVVESPYGRVGDLLRVTETWRYEEHANEIGVRLKRDMQFVRASKMLWHFIRPKLSRSEGCSAWRGQAQLPAWFPAIVLRIESVRVERLQDIDFADIRGEGICCPEHDFPGGFCCSECPSLRRAFAEVWASINGAESWKLNPWVFVISFAVAGKGER